MSAAIFGLIGVAVGALVTGGVELFLENYRAKQARRASLRLLRYELDSAGGMLSTSMAQNVLWPPTFELPTQTWNSDRALLARTIRGDGDWKVVSTAFAGLADLNRYFAAVRTMDEEIVEETDAIRQGIPPVLQHLDPAAAAIDRLLAAR